jgi:hypothetical protein
MSRKSAQALDTPFKCVTPTKSDVPSDESPLIPSSEWRRKNGNVTARTEYNWELKKIIPPAVRINGRKYRPTNTRPQFDGATP